MKRENLIKLIDEHLQITKYKRNKNYHEYSLDELLKVIKLYKININ
jgi:hypothetical protein